MYKSNFLIAAPYDNTELPRQCVKVINSYLKVYQNIMLIFCIVLNQPPIGNERSRYFPEDHQQRTLFPGEDINGTMRLLGGL